MKTVVYIDGQNFLYKISDVLIKTGLIRDKQELITIDIPHLLSSIIPNVELDIRFYGVKKIRRRPEWGEDILNKSIVFSDNLRRLRNYLGKTGVEYIEVGNLKVRDSDVCKKCGAKDYRFQEKGVDVGMAVDIVRDVFTGKVDDIILVSSDTDLIPAILIAKEFGKNITYVGFEDRLTKALIDQSGRTIAIRNNEVIGAFRAG